VIDPGTGNAQVLRRRRTRRHRRNRLVRRWLFAAAMALFTASVSTLALMYFSPSLFRAKDSAPPVPRQSELNRNSVLTLDHTVSDQRSNRPVYPYSVVPGGVENVKELKWVAEHDPVVAAHYAGFDYARAQVVRLTLARTVYVSYRIGNRIYWTRRRLTLHKGEKLITDGRMTARTRCANRVEETPQQAASPVEPPVEKFDQPARVADGTAVQSPPVPFQSALLTRPATSGPEPVGPLSLYNPFVGGNWVPVAPPPLPTGVCAPVKKKEGTGTGGTGTTGEGGKKKKEGPCGSTEVVPEPGTWVMFLSGLAAIYWQARRKLIRA
jgi:hypothetical protein